MPHGSVVRRLLPIECERLMSWPDNWTQYGAVEIASEIVARGGHVNYEKPERTADEETAIRKISDSARYKMCGNGVVSAVVYAIAARIPDSA